jgi:hypothetical protein
MRLFLACIFTMILASASSRGAEASGPQPQGAAAASNDNAGIWEHQLSGRILSAKGSQLEVETRDKRSVEVDAATAINSHRTNVLSAGGFITAVGAYDAKGVFHAQTIQRAKNSTKTWPADR